MNSFEIQCEFATATTHVREIVELPVTLLLSAAAATVIGPPMSPAVLLTEPSTSRYPSLLVAARSATVNPFASSDCVARPVAKVSSTLGMFRTIGFVDGNDCTTMPNGSCC